jgi:hypothetical protein
MASLLLVGFWSSPILLEKHSQPMLSTGQVVFWVHRTQQIVGFDAAVKSSYKFAKNWFSADLFVKRIGH